MTQAQAISSTSIALSSAPKKARPVLSLIKAQLSVVTDTSDPDPAMLFEALWRFDDALPYSLRGNEDADNIVKKSMMHTLWLADNPFNPEAKTKLARKTFHAMLASFEREHGKGNLPECVFKRARWLGLIGSERPSEPKETKDAAASAAKLADAKQKRELRKQRDRDEYAAKNGQSTGSGGGEKKSKKSKKK